MLINIIKVYIMCIRCCSSSNSSTIELVDVVSMCVVITDVTSCNIAYQFIVVLYYFMFFIICIST